MEFTSNGDIMDRYFTVMVIPQFAVSEITHSLLARSEDPLLVRFEVVARLADSRRSVVRLRTAMNTGGHMTVD